VSILNDVQQILSELGVPRDGLDPASHRRADLALDSSETTELELALTRVFHVKVDLWDRQDYTLADLAHRIERDVGAHSEVVDHSGSERDPS